MMKKTDEMVKILSERLQLGFIATDNERLLPAKQIDGLEGRWPPLPLETCKLH